MCVYTLCVNRTFGGVYCLPEGFWSAGTADGWRRPPLDRAQWRREGCSAPGERDPQYPQTGLYRLDLRYGLIYRLDLIKTGSPPIEQPDRADVTGGTACMFMPARTYRTLLTKRSSWLQMTCALCMMGR